MNLFKQELQYNTNKTENQICFLTPTISRCHFALFSFTGLKKQ